ncbi:MAG: hypothetical protein COB85_02330 [Bacteroidetes bacterium]|nr:MAG: hypothetical protein COB85_02330 [Bacteroidota bacterium]
MGNRKILNYLLTIGIFLVSACASSEEDQASPEPPAEEMMEGLSEAIEEAESESGEGTEGSEDGAEDPDSWLGDEEMEIGASWEESEENGDLHSNTAMIAGRDFLIGNSKEVEGYGLYSYFLLGSKPDDNNRERYLAIIGEFLNITEAKILEEEYDRSRQDINITYFPLIKKPIKNVSAEWILDHYDFTRARILLNNLSSERLNGVYIISTVKVLSKNPIGSDSYLFQNLTTVHHSLVKLWVEEFLKQSSKPNFWEKEDGNAFIMNMRNHIAISAEALNIVKVELDKWLAWINS